MIAGYVDGLDVGRVVIRDEVVSDGIVEEEILIGAGVRNRSLEFAIADAESKVDILKIIL